MKSSREFYCGPYDPDLTPENLEHWARVGLNQADEAQVRNQIHMGQPLTEIAAWIERAQEANPGW